MNAQAETTAEKETIAPTLPIRLEGAAFEAVKAKIDACNEVTKRVTDEITAYGETLKQQIIAAKDDLENTILAHTGVPGDADYAIDRTYESLGLLFIGEREEESPVKGFLDAITRAAKAA